VIISSMWSFSRVKVIQTDLVDYLSNTTLPNYWAFLEWDNVHAAQFEPTWNIVIWNESHWISQEIAKYITDKITIPRFWKAESLNAWVATWVIIDNILRNISK
jgi:TrmH family RNA methyltransferase